MYIACSRDKSRGEGSLKYINNRLYLQSRTLCKMHFPLEPASKEFAYASR